MQTNFRTWKKKKQWLYSATALAVVVGGTVVTQANVIPNIVQVAHAQGVVNGTQIGTLHGKPLIQSQTIDMDSQEFQDMVDSILKDTNTDGIRYVADSIGWMANTQVDASGIDTILKNFSSSHLGFLGKDGFNRNDKGKYMQPGESMVVTNVGTVTDLKTNEKVPVHLQVVYNDSEHGPDGNGADKTLAMAIKSQSGVITVGVGVNAKGSGINSGGSVTEGGNVSTGLDGAYGLSAGWIERVRVTVNLVNANTGEVIPNDELIMAMKVSDIDGFQRAKIEQDGVFAYIVSPDTKMSVFDDALRSSSSEVFNADTTQLSSNSYVVLKRGNQTVVDFKYTDGQGNHLTIVMGFFGNTGFELNVDKTGVIAIDKSGTTSGKNMLNSYYSLAGNVFKVTNKETSESFTLITDENGYAQVSDVPFGTYTVEEMSSSKGFKQTFTTQNVTLSIDSPKVTVNGQDEQVVTVSGTDDEYLGDVTIQKTGVESNTTMWNKHYSLAGNTFTLTHRDTKQVFTLTTDENGQAKQSGMPLGVYDVVETKASNGFVKTFEPQVATLTQDGVLSLTVSGTNKEIKGKHTLTKADKDTGSQSQGKGTLKTAQYGLFYADTNEPVKWTDNPKPELLAGTKVTSSQVNGKTVEHGDNVVIDVDDDNLKASVGNLALGRYYWKEINAPIGYAIDSTKHEFTIDKVDDNTDVVTAPDSQSTERVIKAKISLQKLLQASSDLNASGYNDINFTFKPLDGTIAQAKTVTTAAKDDEDGFASVELEYGDWVMTEDNAPNGYKAIEPVYIHMTTDDTTDVITITASHNADGSQPFSKRTFTQSDDNTDKNEHTTGSVSGVVSSSNAFISLSRLTLKNNTVTPDEDDFQPEKFVLSEQAFDVKGTSLLDDDSELSNKYDDTNANPYVDKDDNNEPQNINTKWLKRGDNVYYQVWLDTNQFEQDDKLTKLGIKDTFSEYFTLSDVNAIKVYDKQTGSDVTEYFNISVTDNTLDVHVNDNGKANGIVDTNKVAFGRYYVIDIPGKVSDNAPANTDIENVAEQYVSFDCDGNGTHDPNHPNHEDGDGCEVTTKKTQKRVNKVEEPQNPTPPQPQKPVTPNLPKTGSENAVVALLSGVGVLLLAISLQFIAKKDHQK